MSQPPDRGAHRATFSEILVQTGAVCALVVPVPAAAIVLLVGGPDLLDAGALVATGIAIPVITLFVSWFRYQRGAAGFPLRRPVQPGDRVRDWLVLDRLQGEVRPDSTYMVRRSDDFGVLKVRYHPDDPAAQERAAREGEYLASVRSRHVVTVLDRASTSTATYLITRYLGGQTIRDRRRSGPLSEAELYSVAAGTLSGLRALDAAGVTHRDLTPRNVMVDDNGGATIIDLGVARVDATTQLTMTRSHTVGYRAPEQFEGRSEPVSDVFVWAATMYFLVTGVDAFSGEDAEVQDRIRSTTPDLSVCPAWLQPVLRESFIRDPDLRPSAADALVSLKKTNQAGWTVGIPAVPRPRRTTRVPSWVTPSAVVSVVVLLLLTIFLQNEQSNGSPPQASAGESAPSTPDPFGNGGRDQATTATEPSDTPTPTSSPTPSPPTNTPSPPPPAGLTAEFIGVWHGASVGSNGEVPVVFAIDNPAAGAEGDPIGRWTYPSCSGSMQLVSSTATELVFTPVEAQADCGFGGQATLNRAGESAAYDWVADDGTESRSGTFVRSPRINLDNPGWPTDRNEARPAFYAYLGVCATGGPGCSESGQTPTWTACTDDLCIGGGGASVVDVWRNLDWLLEIPDGTPNTAVALLGVGFTEDQVVDLLDL